MAHPDNQIPLEQPGLDHATVHALLPEYVALASAGRDPEPVHPAVAAHLAACGDCYAAFVELLELAAIAEGDLPSAPMRPPDLGFLRPAPASAPLIVTRSPLGEVLVAFSRVIAQTLSRPRPAGAFRGQLLQQITQPIPGAPPGEVTVDIYERDAGGCKLIVQLGLPDRAPGEQDGARVRLQAGALEREATSNPDGVVVFDGIPLEALPLLRLTVTPG